MNYPPTCFSRGSMSNISDVSVRFPMTKIGAKEAGKYLVSIDRMKDFWAGHPSSHDIVNYANKLWSQLNAH